MSEEWVNIGYGRVSSEKQVTEGHGLDGQEKSCNDYSVQRFGGPLDKFFQDEGISGGVYEREGLQAMFDFIALHKSKGKRVRVVVDDGKRLARDVMVYFQIKKVLQSYDAILESPSQTFEDSPEGRFVETMLAAAAELERNQNKRQVRRRMKARLELGYWSFDNPPSYT